MKFKIRYAEEKDAYEIERLLGCIHKQHSQGRPDLFGGGKPKMNADMIRAVIAGKSTVFLAAADENDILVGYAICMVHPNENPAQRDYKSLYIDDLNVSEEHRRCGIGSALLDRIKEEAKALGCYNVTLNVWAFNSSAIRFYEKSGMFVQRMIMECPVNTGTKE